MLEFLIYVLPKLVSLCNHRKNCFNWFCLLGDVKASNAKDYMYNKEVYDDTDEQKAVYPKFK